MRYQWKTYQRDGWLIEELRDTKLGTTIYSSYIAPPPSSPGETQIDPNAGKRIDSDDPREALGVRTPTGEALGVRTPTDPSCFINSLGQVVQTVSDTEIYINGQRYESLGPGAGWIASPETPQVNILPWIFGAAAGLAVLWWLSRK
jgi:hypothetical protein